MGFADEVVFLQVVLEASVHHALHSLPKAAEQADGAVACLVVSVLSFFQDGSYDGFFPGAWKFTGVPGLVEYFKKSIDFSKASHIRKSKISLYIVGFQDAEFANQGCK